MYPWDDDFDDDDDEDDDDDDEDEYIDEEWNGRFGDWDGEEDEFDENDDKDEKDEEDEDNKDKKKKSKDDDENSDGYGKDIGDGYGKDTDYRNDNGDNSDKSGGDDSKSLGGGDGNDESKSKIGQFVAAVKEIKKEFDEIKARIRMKKEARTLISTNKILGYCPKCEAYSIFFSKRLGDTILKIASGLFGANNTYTFYCMNPSCKFNYYTGYCFRIYEYMENIEFDVQKAHLTKRYFKLDD